MKHQLIAQTLQAITSQMQLQGLWQVEPPSPQKLASKLPFCVDTLTFSQWLQWVMFPKLFVIIETKATLPSKSNMAVMAEQAFKAETTDTAELLDLIRQLDQHITAE
jgi:uncharacterized protein YqcC (DUF446 family)